jgi:copper chaperone CopZ
VAAGLRRVRGVTDVQVERGCDEAVVTRRQGTAPTSELVDAVRRTGYGATLVPVFRTELDCPDLDCAGCPERVRSALERAPGVRGVTLSTRTRIVVFYDRRRTGPETIRQVVLSQGFGCAARP